MYHAVSDKPVVSAGVGVERIWAYSRIFTAKRRRYLTRHFKIIKCELFEHGRMNTR